MISGRSRRRSSVRWLRRLQRVRRSTRRLLEALIHKFFGSARLDLELIDRFGRPVESTEWFLLPLPVIEEAIEKIKDGTIGSFRYDSETARIVEV